MTRVLSGIVLAILAVSTVGFAPSTLFLIVAELLVVLACREYAHLVQSARISVPLVVCTAGAMLTVAAFAPIALRALFWAPLDTILMTAFTATAAISLARWDGAHDAVASVSASLLPLMYFGLPIGAMVATREMFGPPALFLLMAVVFGSDTAQYYAGRHYGRRALAPVISPKKTIEGALGGVVAGVMVMVVGGYWVMPESSWLFRALLAMTLVALGIAGDLFESVLKRSAGVKDSSTLIPGHGGVMDRIDALLFAAPIHYVVLKYLL